MKIVINIFASIFLLIAIILILSLYPTKNIAKFIVKSNSNYFVENENSNKYLNLYYDFLIQNFFKNNFLKNSNNVEILRAKTKSFLIDQDESSFFNENINIKNSNFSLGSIIIYGFGACESINGILGLRLSKVLKEDIELFALYNVNKQISYHALLRTNFKNKFYFIDIWGVNRNIKYTFEESIVENNPEIKIYNKNIYPNHNFTKEEFLDGYVIKKFKLINYFNSLIYKITKINKTVHTSEYNTKISKIYVSNKIINKLAKKKLINIYIDARFKHIIEGYKSAEKLYDLIISSNCNFNFCKISKTLKKKNSQI